MSADLILSADDGFEFPVYQARPAQPARAAVVVLQEIFGLNNHIRAVVDAYARQGYLALAPATFHRVRPGVDMAYTPQDVAAGVALKAQVESLPAPGVLRDIQATVDHATRALGAARVGVLGYCWGGWLAWRAACELQGLSVAVCYYGGGMTAPAEIARVPRVPVLAHFARHDHAIALDGVEAFRQAHPEVVLHLYDAQHGFNCDQRAAWNPQAAALALQRTLAFIHENTL